MNSREPVLKVVNFATPDHVPIGIDILNPAGR